MGLSGSGKSTLIRHLNRLIEPTFGQVIVGGQDVLSLTPKSYLHLGKKYVYGFSKVCFIPHKTILENIGYGLTFNHSLKMTG